MTAVEIARAVRSGSLSAVAVTEAALRSIEERNEALNCFTGVTRERALDEAAAVDAAVANGRDPGPLAGVPYAAKNLFDVAGLPTLAGSIIRAQAHPAAEDATVIQRLRSAGAVLTGTCNMDEFAYGFVTENSHYGPTHNPHDLSRVAGGSSGGSAAAVAADIVPLSLGSDTNGSIRVPASFCGIFGLKATYGRISRAGAFLFSPSLDHVGPFTRCVEDLAVCFDVLQGPDARDPVCSSREIEPSVPGLQRGVDGLRMAVAGGYFAQQADAQVSEAAARVAHALGAAREIDVPEAARARAAAFVITSSEGASLHLPDLKSQPENFDPATRSRFLAGALIPAVWVHTAQRFRAWFRSQMRRVLEDVDVLIAPAAPCPAIRIGQKTIVLDGVEVPARPNLGVFTQPISFVGLPVVTVPVLSDGKLPVGVQLIGAPFTETKLLRAARQLERAGVAKAAISVHG